jgi:pimeloyl-ACP methyl ester carboxylesterase
VFLGLFILLGVATVLILVGYVVVVSWEVRHPARQTAGWALAHQRPSSPSDFDLPFTEWSVDRPDGTVLPVWEIPADPTSDREDAALTPVVVVLHGWSRSRIDSLCRVQQLLKDPSGGARAFRTIIPELRGHGDASAGPTTLGTKELEDLDALLEQVGSDRVILLGHSLGAVLTIHLATRHPAQIRSVIALAPYDRLSTPFDGYLRSQNYPAGFLARVIEQALRLFGVRVRNTIDVAPGVTMPLQVLVGSEDRVCPQAIARRICDAAPHSSFHLMPETGHSNHHVSDPETLENALGEALRDARGSVNDTRPAS